ncbi:MAG: DUF1624 domain-containing protein [Rhizobiaceae bacterium]
MPTATKDKSRIEAIDLARGAALAAMIVFHFAWDLEFFGYAPAGMTRETGWALFARAIASSFLFLVGVSLFLAHAKGIRLRSFGKRLAMVGGAALAITVVTFFATPQGFIFFGILHQIALASVLGLFFLRVPTLATVAVAVLVIAAPAFLRHAFFDHPALWWVGLSTTNPQANDYVPLFPWFGAVLLGIAAARIGVAQGLFERLAAWNPGAWSRPAQFAGRHSLAVYLIHQPVLIGAIWLFALVVPPQARIMPGDFAQACQAECLTVRDEAFCQAYCACMLEAVEREGLSEAMWQGDRNGEVTATLEGLAFECSIESEAPSQLENQP